MKISSLSVSMAAVALLTGGVALWPANAQQPAGDKPSTPPAGSPEKPARQHGPREGGGGDDWQTKLGVDIREHPSIGRALGSLHQAKAYLEKSDSDLGGHKASSIKAVDDAIKELSEAIKFDPKHAPGPDDRGGRGPRGGGGEGGGKGGGGGGDHGGGGKPPADAPGGK